MICGACGKTGESLKLCTACKAVRYCDVSCQKNHRKAHRKECSRKALALKLEAQEEINSTLEALSLSVPADLDDPNSDLWKCPPRPECPICMLPLPLYPNGKVYMPCCGNTVCGGCELKNQVTIHQNQVARRINAPLEKTCAFCRKKVPPSTKEQLERVEKRMELNDPEAFVQMAQRRLNPEKFDQTGRRRLDDLPKDEQKGLQYLVRAAELGSVNAYAQFAYYYRLGRHVKADKEKNRQFLKLAAMGGDMEARGNLGVMELKNSRIDLALRHWKIAAEAGHEISLQNFKEGYVKGLVSKDEFTKTLHAHQVAQKELTSEDRTRYSAMKPERKVTQIGSKHTFKISRRGMN